MQLKNKKNYTKNMKENELQKVMWWEEEEVTRGDRRGESVVL